MLISQKYNFFPIKIKYFKINDIVYHKNLGKGIILNICGEKSDVLFIYGKITLLTKFCYLNQYNVRKYLSIKKTKTQFS